MSAAERHLNSFSKLRGGGKRNKQPAVEKQQVVSSIPVEYEVLKELAASEWSSLKTVDRDIKKEQQRRYLDKYRDFLTDYIDQGDNYHNIILFYGLMWAADTKDFDFAITLGDVISKTGQRFETGFKRDAITICCDEIMLEQEKVFDKEQTLTTAFMQVFERIDAKSWKPDNVITTGKFYRMAGRDALHRKDYKQAHDYFCLADTINPKAGVKKLIEQTAAQI